MAGAEHGKKRHRGIPCGGSHDICCRIQRSGCSRAGGVGHDRVSAGMDGSRYAGRRLGRRSTLVERTRHNASAQAHAVLPGNAYRGWRARLRVRRQGRPPVNTALQFPGIEGSDAYDLSAVYFGQKFGDSVSLIAGKISNWGIGYYYASFASGLKDLDPPYPDIRDEQGLEVFYNFAVTPWLVIGADVQFIRPGLDHDTAIFTGIRTVIRF